MKNLKFPFNGTEPIFDSVQFEILAQQQQQNTFCHSLCVQRDKVGVLLGWTENQGVQDIKEKWSFNALPLHLFHSLALGQSDSEDN